MPLDATPPRSTRFGSPLVLSRVHWVRPELVAEVKFLTWMEDLLLRQVVYEGLREDKPTREVRRDIVHPKPGAGDKSASRKSHAAVNRHSCPAMLHFAGECDHGVDRADRYLAVHRLFHLSQRAPPGRRPCMFDA
jgi:bifunctional non-homologous end joining protein LigD